MGQGSRLNPFARSTTVGLPAVVRDLFGRPLEEGDKVYLHVQVPPPFMISKIQPVVDPTQPQNMMDITVTCVLQFRATRNAPNQEFTRIIEGREKPEPADLSGANSGQEPPA